MQLPRTCIREHGLPLARGRLLPKRSNRQLHPFLPTNNYDLHLRRAHYRTIIALLRQGRDCVVSELHCGTRTYEVVENGSHETMCAYMRGSGV